jgi:nucleoid-associated protein YgaU
MSITPLSAIRQGLIQAYLEILVPTVPDPVIPLRFNPSEYQLQKANNFAEIGIPGLESPPIQFVRGAAEKLSVELLLDTSDTLEDVRTKYVNKLRDLMRLNTELHAPPIVAFTWDTQIFKGVMESLNITYVMFSPEGVPLRAKLSVSLKEYRPAAVQFRESQTSSPDFDKSIVFRRGDTLASIAAQVYRDPGLWREIARANKIQDPRRIEPGLVLNLPKLR